MSVTVPVTLYDAGKTYTGVMRLEPFTEDEIARLSRDQRNELRGGVWRAPAPFRVPKPPDYSTPAAVTARCREIGGYAVVGPHASKRVGQWWEPKDATFRTLYRAFLAAL